MKDSSGEKTEKPTPRKLREARKEGQIPRSQEIGAWAGVLAGAYLLQFTIAVGGPRLARMFDKINALIEAPTRAAALDVFSDGATTVAILLAPLCLGLALTTFIGGAVQGGVRLATKNLKPKPKRMSPLQGFKRIAGPNAAWEAGKTVAKTTVAAIVAYRAVAGTAEIVTSAGSLPLDTIIDLTAAAAIRLMRDMAIAGLVMGLADYAYQRHRTGKQLKMTKHEVKQENKNTEGDPHLKGAIRSKQIAMSRNRMMTKVAEADVVLVNPTHVAVALRYRPDQGAPRVVAKGSGHVAARIREQATKHRVPMVTDVPLARALHAACDLNDEIPAELFTAVAQVLAFVLSLKARGSAAGTHTMPALTPSRT